MSAHPTHESAAEAHHAHSHGHEAGHGSFKGYMIGFLLSVVLTAIPFWLVMAGVLESKLLTAVLVMGIGVVQIFVHMVYF
ncbi:MAG: cytochrome C oxidase subunit IV family protein, partial [Rhizobiales bacterium]|nr:cytochrome C oxidase subunit IV family protein [Hyphomicrobiales bacterium]